MHLVLDLLDQTLTVRRRYELPHRCHVLVLLERLGNLLHNLVHLLLNLQHPLALLGLGIRMQALADGRHALL